MRTEKPYLESGEEAVWDYGERVAKYGGAVYIHARTASGQHTWGSEKRFVVKAKLSKSDLNPFSGIVFNADRKIPKSKEMYVYGERT